MKILGPCIFIIIGITIGVLLRDLSLLNIKAEVGIGDIANFILAVVIAFIVPISLSTWLDNKRHIKDFLIEEIKLHLGIIRDIKKVFDDCHMSDATEKKDIKEIMLKLQESEMQTNSLIRQLEQSFKSESEKIRTSLKDGQSEYWKIITEGSLLNEGYKIDFEACKSHRKAFYKFQMQLKRSVHVINNY